MLDTIEHSEANLCCANIQDDMLNIVNHFAQSIIGIRSASLTAGVIDSVIIDGTQIKFLATTNKVGGVINIYPYDLSTLPHIISELNKQGFNAYVYSRDCGRVNCPPPSGDEKKKIFAHIDKLAECAKIGIRNVRQKYRKLDKDDKSIQKSTDEAVSMVDGIVQKKKASI